MKIFTRAQIKELDQFTIDHEPIKSVDLMERAAHTVVNFICSIWSVEDNVVVFAGPGNNGGDGLAVARMMANQGYGVTAYLFNISARLSPDCMENSKRLKNCPKVNFIEVTEEFEPPKLDSKTLVVDALFGSGTTKPLAGGFASLVKYINAAKTTVVSIDVPSGLMTEDNSYNVRANIVRATYTVTFQQPKLAFFFPENQCFIGKLEVVDINLSQEGIDKMSATFETIEEKHIKALFKQRDPFAHKGMMGHGLLVAGSYGVCGAAILAAKACLRSGVGKVTVHVPRFNIPVMQVAVPEAVISCDDDDAIFTQPVDMQDYEAMAIGPGLGCHETTAIATISQLRRAQCKVVADADTLNILGAHHAWMQQLPKGLIMTPHPKEMDRMTGHSNDSYERMLKALDLAARIQGYIIVKGHHSLLCCPDGKVYINTTGNAGMATAGSGDVLTGIILALLAQGYNQKEACIMAMYVHGRAGDIASADKGQTALVASDIIDFLPKAFRELETQC